MAAADQPADTWNAEYWNATRQIPATAADLTRNEDTIDHDWGEGSPGPGIGVDHFAARYTRTLAFAPGNYDFAVTADDGVRLYVDGVKVIDKWVDEAPTTYHVTLPMDGGLHNIVMEYYEATVGATAKLNWSLVGDPAQDGTYHAEYWNVPDAVGVPETVPNRPADLVREDHSVDFNWGEGSPDQSIEPDKFMARWSKTVTLSAGVYRFTAGHDDAIRVYLDGNPIINHWSTGNTDDTVDKAIPSGDHTILIEYFESGGDARAEFDYERLGDYKTADGGWAAQFYAGRDLAGDPVLTRSDDAIDFDWGGGAPGIGVGADNFSARWTKSVNITDDGSYKFTATSDDGVRVYVDGDLAIDQWTPHGATTYTAARQLSAGPHQIVVEYFEGGGDAVAKFSYEKTDDPPPPPPDPFTGQYFDNTTLSGDPVLTRLDNSVDFDWGEGAPNPALPADRFSARWTRTKSYAAGSYHFSVTGDDGIRLFIDGHEVVDGWDFHSPTTYTADVPLTEGEHTMVVEYFEWTGGAVAKYNETRISD